VSVTVNPDIRLRREKALQKIPKCRVRQVRFIDDEKEAL